MHWETILAQILWDSTMSKVLKTFGLAGAVLALLALHGAHWAGLQAFAWSRMLIDYSQQGTLLTALDKTFNGQNPCALCHKVREGTAADQKTQKESSGEKPRPVDAFWELRVALTPGPGVIPHKEQGYATIFCSDFIDSPPSPPPRSVAS
jgi:hypothetical protein